ncbi:MAG: ferrochelatase [Acidimicrobiales bacterium]
MTLGVVVMAYGTPRAPEDVEAYYTHIRRGRAPTPELLEDLRARYAAIGGASPLWERTAEQARAIERALGQGFSVAVGQKHAPPFIEDAVATMAAAGAERLVGVVLAPHHSRGSVGEYASRLSVAAEAAGLRAVTIERWHDLPEWRAFQAAAVREGMASLPERTKVIFSAHSLPEKVLVGDPYPDQLHESAAAIAAAAGLSRWSGWGLAWQSAGRTPDAWRGPDIRAVLRDLAATRRADGVLVCPQGFTADHLEVLYDLDVEARAVATELDLRFERTRSLNADGTVFAAIARRISASF